MYAVDLDLKKLLFRLPGFVSHGEKSGSVLMITVWESVDAYSDRFVHYIGPETLKFDLADLKGFTIV